MAVVKSRPQTAVRAEWQSPALRAYALRHARHLALPARRFVQRSRRLLLLRFAQSPLRGERFARAESNQFFDMEAASSDHDFGLF